MANFNTKLANHTPKKILQIKFGGKDCEFAALWTVVEYHRTRMVDWHVSLKDLGWDIYGITH
eukprot:2541481-Amphidinium_carterae.1